MHKTEMANLVGRFDRLKVILQNEWERSEEDAVESALMAD